MDYDESDIQASYPDKFVCSNCFDDDHLKAFIDDTVESRRCSYCGKVSRRKNIAAPILTLSHSAHPASEIFMK